MSPRYPRIAGPFDDWHCYVDVTWEEGEAPQRFCGWGACTGACGLPALIIPIPPTSTNPDRYLKANGSQVACGHVFQHPWARRPWTGARVLVPEEHQKDFEGRIYP